MVDLIIVTVQTDAHEAPHYETLIYSARNVPLGRQPVLDPWIVR